MASADTILRAWLNYNCSQGNNWIVIYKFDEMVRHANRQLMEVSAGKIIPSIRDFNWTSKHLTHVYFTYMTETSVISLVEVVNQLILIHNTVQINETDLPDDTDTGEVRQVKGTVDLPQINSIESKLYLLQSVTDILPCLSGKERKLIGLRDKKWLAGQPPLLKKLQLETLQRVNFLDFIQLPVQDTTNRYVTLLNRWIEQSGDILDLTHNYSITPDYLNQIRDHPRIKQIIINQNFQLGDFQWLRHFPCLRVLNLAYCHQIEYRQIEQMTQVVPKLQGLNIICCTRINLRILLPLLKLHYLEHISINDPQFWCQKGAHELFILPDEWKGLDCPSLAQIAINSSNLTLDVIDYLIKSCGNLQQITVDEEVLKSITQNLVSGHDTENELIFNSWQNPKKGIKAQKKVSFRHLMKDLYDNPMFSDSMLKKIAEIRAQKGEKEQTAIVDVPTSKIHQQ